LTGFVLLEDVFAGTLLTAVAELVASLDVFEMGFDAGSIGPSRPSRARSSLKVSAVVVLGDLVSFITV
jgi:hypothetical protein